MNAKIKQKEQKLLRSTANVSPHFGFRKLGIGLAGILLSTSLFLGGQSSQAQAKTVDDSADDEAVNSDQVDSDDLARPTTDASSDQKDQSDNLAKPQEQKDDTAKKSETAKKTKKHAKKHATKSKRKDKKAEQKKHEKSVKHVQGKKDSKKSVEKKDTDNKSSKKTESTKKNDTVKPKSTETSIKPKAQDSQKQTASVKPKAQDNQKQTVSVKPKAKATTKKSVSVKETATKPETTKLDVSKFRTFSPRMLFTSFVALPSSTGDVHQAQPSDPKTRSDFVGIDGHTKDEAAYVVEPESPDSKYTNPVTGKELPEGTVWKTSIQNVSIRYKAPGDPHNGMELHNDEVKVSFGRSVFFDKNGTIIGYGYGTKEQNGNIDTSDPRNVKIGGKTISQMLPDGIPHGWEVSPDSAKQVKDWIVKPGSESKQIVIYLVKADGSQKIIYVDDDDNENPLKTHTVTGEVGDPVTKYYQPANDLSDLQRQGYKPKENNPFGGEFAPTIGDKDGSDENTTRIHMVHNIIPDNSSKTVTRTIHYNVPSGYTKPVDHVDKIVFTQHGGTRDAVTGKPVKQGTWDADQKPLPTVNTPSIKGLTPDRLQVKGTNVTPDSQNQEITVNYREDTPQTNNEDKKPTRTIHYNVPSIPGKTTPKVPDTVQQGEVTRTNTTKPDGTVDHGPWNPVKGYDEHKSPVVPGYVADKPVIPADNPKDDQPTNVTVNYTPVGKIVPVDPSGKPIPGAEQPQYKNNPDDPTKVTTTDTPKVPGYTADKPSVDPTDPTKDTTVAYHPIDNAKNRTLHVVVKYTYDTIDGKQAHPDDNWDVPQTSTSKDDKGNDVWTPDPNTQESKVKMPSIPDYEGHIQNTGTVGGDTYVIHVVYTKQPQQALSYKVHFVDEDAHNQALRDPITVNGHTGEQAYDPTNDIAPFLAKGYTLDKNDVPKGKNTMAMNGQEYTITFKHGKQNVHGDVPNPSKNPDKAGKKITELAKNVPVTTKYNYDKVTGPKAHDDDVQNIKFEADGVVDMVTGDVTRTSDFTPDKQPNDDIPDIPNYKGQFVDSNNQPIEDPNSDLNDPNVVSVTRHVIYNKDEAPTPDKGISYSVHFVDSDNNNEEIADAVDITNAKDGDDAYDPSDQIKKLEDKGYVLDKNNVPTGKDNADMNGKTYNVSFKHGTQNVHGDVPNPSKNPDKKGQKLTELAKTVPVNTKYNYDTIDGKQAHPDTTQNIKYEADGVVDMVTGDVKRTSDFKPDTQPTNDIPTINGYTGQFVDEDGKPTNNPNKDLGPDATSVTRHVVYNKNADDEHTAHIKFVDQVTGQPIMSKDLTGKSGETLSYSTKDDLNNLIKKGYKVVDDPTGAQPLKIGDHDENLTVTLGHQQKNITRKKTVTRRVRYQVPDYMTAPDPVIQTLEFEDTGTEDMVTHKQTWASDQNPVTKSFDAVQSPDIQGATPDKKSVDKEDVTLSSQNWGNPEDEDVVVTYTADADAKGTPAVKEAPGEDYKGPEQATGKPDQKVDKDNGEKPVKDKKGRHAGGKSIDKKSPSNKSGNKAKPNDGNGHVVQAATVGSEPSKGSLPQTGENNLAIIAMGAIVAGMSALGLYEAKRKKRA